jgi:hypothetical protein
MTEEQLLQAIVKKYPAHAWIIRPMLLEGKEAWSIVGAHKDSVKNALIGGFDAKPADILAAVDSIATQLKLSKKG